MPASASSGREARLAQVRAADVGAEARPRAARARSSRRRRCRRTRTAGPRAHRPARAISSSAISSAASGRATDQHPLGHRREARRIGEQLTDEPGHAVELRVGDDERGSRLLEVARVLRLMVGGRVRVRHEHSRLAREREIVDRAARAAEHEVAGAECRAELVRVREPAGSPAARRGRRSASKSRSPARWRTAGPSAPNSRTTSSLRLRAPWLPPNTSSTGPSAGSSNRRRPSSREVGWDRDGTGRPVTRNFGGCPPVDREREEDASRERGREPVREAEVRVGLGQRRRDPARPRGEHHRPADVAAAAEDDVRPAAREDLPARERRPAGERERPEQRQARLAREAGDVERVELEAGFRNELRLEPIRRPGEGHPYAAAAQGFGDGDRRRHVTARSPGRDHARELAVRLHPRSRC